MIGIDQEEWTSSFSASAPALSGAGADWGVSPQPRNEPAAPKARPVEIVFQKPGLRVYATFEAGRPGAFNPLVDPENWA